MVRGVEVINKPRFRDNKISNWALEVRVISRPSMDQPKDTCKDKAST